MHRFSPNQRSLLDARGEGRHREKRWKFLRDLMDRPEASGEARLYRGLRQIVEAFGAEAGLIGRVEGDALVVDQAWAPGTDLCAGRRIRLAEGDEVLELGEDALIVRNFAREARVPPLLARFGARTYLGVPLRVEGRRQGTVAFLFRTAHLELDDEDRAFVEVVTAWLGAEIARQREAEWLREAEARFRALVEQSLIGVYIIQDGRFAYVNPMLAEIFGYAPEEIVTRCSVMDLVAEEDRALVAETLRQQVEGEEDAIHYGFRGRRKDGRLIEVEVHGRRSIYRGRPAVIGTLLDVTDRKQAESRLQRALAINQQHLEATLDGYILADTEGQIMDVNPSYCRMVGYTREELLAMNIRDMEAQLTPEEIAARIEVMVRDGRARFRTKHRHRDGHPIDLEVSITIIQPEDRPLVAAFVRDITEQKRAQEERERLIAELEARNAELERFTYTVSHDLKSPLVTIQGFLGVLREDLEAGSPEDIEQDLAYIGKAASTMQHLLEDLLNLSRVGRKTNPIERLSMAELVEEALTLVEGELSRRGVEVEVQPDLPAVDGDRMRLLEVWQNLISNAAKYMGEQPSPRIEIGCKPLGDEVCFYVRDNGVGIPPAYHEKVFELFERLGTDTEGTGVGLALVKRIVEFHGGRIWVESEGMGRGSTFYFTLPKSSPAPGA